MMEDMCGLEEVTNPPSPRESRYKVETSTKGFGQNTATYDDESTSSVLIGGGWNVWNKSSMFNC